jgi:amidase
MIAVNGKPQPSTTQMFWAGLSGMANLPSTVAPIGIASDGLPVGVQIVGPMYSDHTCIKFAEILAKEYFGFVPPDGFD